MKKKYSISFILNSFFGGLLVGILTVIGQAYLPGNFNSIANSGAMWLIPAYFIAMRFFKIKQSIISCILFLLGSVLGYYIFESIWNNHTFNFLSYTMIFWIICSFIAGTVFGIAANFGKYSKNMYFNSIGKSMLPAVFIAEGLNILIHRKDYLHMIAVGYAGIIIGLVLIIIIYKKNIIKKETILSLLLSITLGLIFYNLLYIIL